MSEIRRCVTFAHCVYGVCECVSEKGTALVNQGLIKRAGFIWSEQYVQEPLVSYVSNRDLSSDTEQGGAPVKSNNLLCVQLVQIPVRGSES